MIRTACLTAAIDLAAEIEALEALGGGGVATFSGVVRGDAGDRGPLVALELEAWPAMAERALGDIAAQATARWPLLGLVLLHRHGRLPVGERIVFIGTAARHRAAALDACAFLIDWAKTKAPFWKREWFADGSTRWVEARGADDAAAARWV